MKLLTKLTLFTTLSKIAIVLLFVWLLPSLVDRVAFEYANHRLQQQEKKVFAVIEKNGKSRDRAWRISLKITYDQDQIA